MVEFPLKPIMPRASTQVAADVSKTLLLASSLRTPHPRGLLFCIDGRGPPPLQQFVEIDKRVLIPLCIPDAFSVGECRSWWEVAELMMREGSYPRLGR
jgi:hypothetical protein